MKPKNREDIVEEGVIFHTLEYFLIAFPIVITACILGIVIYFCRYGFDFTDESFYIIWLSNPTDYSIHIPVSFFGYIYHPLHVLLDGDIAALRIANVLITLSFSSILSFSLLQKFWFSKGGHLSLLLTLSTAISIFSLVNFDTWLITPNYNTLAFQALVITLIGLILLSRLEAWKYTAGSILIGIGGWLAFMAKPTTAVALALLVPLCWFVLEKRRWYPLALAAMIAVSLLLFSALMIAGTATAFLHRVEISIEILRLLGSGQEFAKIFRFDEFQLTASDRILILFTSFFIFFAALSFVRQRSIFYLLSATGCFIAAIAAIFIILIGHPHLIFDKTSFFIIPLFLFLFSLIYLRGRYFDRFSREHLTWTILLLITPHMYAFGTSRNYWSSGSTVAFFWMLAALVLLSPIVKMKKGILALIPVTLIFQLFTAIIVNNAIEHPYQQPHSLRENSASFNFREKGELLLSDEFRNYLSEAMHIGRAGGFQFGTPILDLTGRSPGILYALGGKVIGQPWLVGAYPGSDLLAISSLDTVNCKDIAAAWLLEEPEGPRRLSTSTVLEHIGANRNSDYEIVGSFKTAAYAGGYIEPYIQKLLKPTRPSEIAVSACLKARKNSSSSKE